MSPNRRTADTGTVDQRRELRQHIARILDARTTAITKDAVATLAYTGPDPGDDVGARLADLVIQKLIIGIRAGEVESRSAQITDFRQLSREKALPLRQLFDLVYMVERAALDEIALDESFGASTEPWPVIAQLVRRSSFELLAAFAERLRQEAGDAALIDPLTTLHTRAVLIAATQKEIQRSERFGHPYALIVFDVDRLAEINARHGHGFGDRVLERVGIVIRNYFRVQDWVSRCSGDAFGVLLPETHREQAEALAERVRETVQERMSLRDYRTDEQVLVTLSVAVVSAAAVDAPVRAEQLLEEAERAVHRAKHARRTRVERMDSTVKPPADDPEVL